MCEDSSSEPGSITELYHMLTSLVLIHIYALRGGGERTKEPSPAVWPLPLMSVTVSSAGLRTTGLSQEMRCRAVRVV